MQEITRFENPDKLPVGVETGMGGIIVIMDMPGRRMGDDYVDGAFSGDVPCKRGKESHYTEVHLRL